MEKMIIGDAYGEGDKIICKKCNDEPAVHECIECGRRDCPFQEPLHYHHDGCPCCESEWGRYALSQKCIYCNEYLKPTSAIFRFTDEQKQKFKEMFGFDLPTQEEFICTKCGQMYDKDFRKMRLKLSRGVKNGRSSKMPKL